MPLLQAYTMNLECISMFYVIFAEATGVSSISSKIGSLNKEDRGGKKKKAKITPTNTWNTNKNILTVRGRDTQNCITKIDVEFPHL